MCGCLLLSRSGCNFGVTNVSWMNLSHWQNQLIQFDGSYELWLVRDVDSFRNLEHRIPYAYGQCVAGCGGLDSILKWKMFLGLAIMSVPTG